MRFIAFLICALLSCPAHAADIDIFDAARKGDAAAIEAYTNAGGDLDARNDDGYTPFILATYNGQLAAAKLLAEKGADTCAVDARGSNSYMGVAYKGDIKMAQWLLESSKCDINLQNNAGQSALMMAALFDRADVAELFIKHGADAKLVDAQGNTAQSLAAGQGLTHVLDIIRFAAP